MMLSGLTSKTSGDARNPVHDRQLETCADTHMIDSRMQKQVKDIGWFRAQDEQPKSSLSKARLADAVPDLNSIIRCRVAASDSHFAIQASTSLTYV